MSFLSNPFKVLLLLIVLYCTLSCKVFTHSYINQEFKLVDSCRSTWKNDTLKSVLPIIVLLFQPSESYDITYYPAFIIGKTFYGDTIGFIDDDFSGVISINDTVVLSPPDWNIEPGRIPAPLCILYREPKLNRLSCSIKKLYFCSFSND